MWNDIKQFDSFLFILPFSAPANCLQYERSVQGEIRSFNYPIEFDSFASSPATFERSQSGRRWHRSNRQKTTVESGSDRRLAESGYPNSLDYVICFERKSGFCSIGYSFDPTQTPFEVGAADRGHKLPAGIGRQAMTDSTTYRLMSVCEDDTDFVAIGTHRLCSRSLALDASSLMVELNLTSRPTTVWPAADQTSNISASSDGNLTQLPLHLEAQLLTNLNADSTYRQGRSDREAWSRVDFGNDAHTINNTQLTLLDDSPGPFLLRFVSNHARNGQGFHFNFKQIPCN